MSSLSSLFLFFFFNDTATTEIYTLSLHDALPICLRVKPSGRSSSSSSDPSRRWNRSRTGLGRTIRRSEEHTSELQSQSNLVCRLLLEKKKTNSDYIHTCQTYVHNDTRTARQHLLT